MFIKRLASLTRNIVVIMNHTHRWNIFNTDNIRLDLDKSVCIIDIWYFVSYHCYLYFTNSGNFGLF